MAQSGEFRSRTNLGDDALVLQTATLQNPIIFGVAARIRMGWVGAPHLQPVSYLPSLPPFAASFHLKWKAAIIEEDL